MKVLTKIALTTAIVLSACTYRTISHELDYVDKKYTGVVVDKWSECGWLCEYTAAVSFPEKGTIEFSISAYNYRNSYNIHSTYTFTLDYNVIQGYNGTLEDAMLPSGLYTVGALIRLGWIIFIISLIAGALTSQVVTTTRFDFDELMKK